MLVDSNLLVLYLVGEFDRQQISKLRRTKTFTIRDYLVLKQLLEIFSVRITTPNILTEVSNLSGDIPGHLRQRFFGRVREMFNSLEEEYLPSAVGAAHPMFERFGLTDAIIADVVKDRYLVITADFPLANYLESNKADVINLNHLRSFVT